MISFIFSVNKKLRLTITLIYLLIVAVLSLIPSYDIPQISLFEGVDKLVHFCMYLGFAWLFCWLFHSESKSVTYYFILLLTIGWGVLMEVLQFVMHYGRTFEWLDIAADSFGAIAGILIYKLLTSVRREK